MIILGTAKYRALQDSIAQMESLVHQVRAELASYQSPSKPVRMSVTEVGDDWIKCLTHQAGVFGGAEIYVAKPKEVRKSSTPGGYTHTNSVTRTHTASSEEQSVYPGFVVADTIYGAIVHFATGVKDPEDNEIYWIDLTPRFWTHDCEAV